MNFKNIQSILSNILVTLRAEGYVKRISKQSGSVLLSNSLIQLISLAGGVLMARALGPTGKGETAAVLLYLQTSAWMAGLGLSRGNVYLLSRSTKDIGPQIFTHSLFISVTLGSVAAVFLYLLFPMLFADFSDLAAMIGRPLFLCLPLFILSDQLMNIFLGYKRYSLYNAKRIAETSIYFLPLFFLFMFNRLNVGTALMSFLAATAASVILGMFLLRRVSRVGLQMDPGFLRSALSFGLKAHMGDMSRLGVERLDRIIIAPWLGPHQFGLYAVATTVSSVLLTLVNPLATVIFPELASYADKDHARNTTVRTLLLVCPIVFSLTGVLFWISPTVIPLLFGEEFKGSIAPARLLIIGTAFLSIFQVLQYCLLGLGYPQYTSYANILSLLMTTVLLFVLVPRFGILGAAWTSMLAYMLQCAAGVALLFKVKTKSNGRKLDAEG